MGFQVCAVDQRNAPRQADACRADSSALVMRNRCPSSSASGSEIVLTILDPGDWFGEVAILAGATNSHDAIARGNCEVAFIPTSGFRQLLARQPELHGRFVTLLAHRVRLLVDIVEDLTTLPLAARLAKRVLAMTDSQAM